MPFFPSSSCLMWRFDWEAEAPWPARTQRSGENDGGSDVFYSISATSKASRPFRAFTGLLLIFVWPLTVKSQNWIGWKSISNEALIQLILFFTCQDSHRLILQFLIASVIVFTSKLRLLQQFFWVFSQPVAPVTNFIQLLVVRTLPKLMPQHLWWFDDMPTLCSNYLCFTVFIS